MMAPGQPEAGRSGSKPPGRGMVAALALALGLSLLVLAYSIQALVFPGSSPPGRAWLLALMAGSVLAAAAGAFALRDLAASPGSMSRPEPGAHEPLPAAMPGAESQGAEGQPYGLLDTFSRMLGTIEQQAAEINQYAQRLESAHREIESSNARLKEFSFKDEVTGLYNRRFFSIRLEEEVSRYRRFNHPVSVVLLDLDGFKAVNDELGHAAGDETLRGVADILLKHSRGINVICRYGGDEFAVLLVETSKAGARLYADRIRAVLPARAFSHGRRVTASFGIASLPEDVAPAPDDLIQAADEALYAAKRAGKNRVSVLEDIGVPRGARPGARPE